MAFLYYSGFKGGFAVPGHLDLYAAIAAVDTFGFVTIPVIVVIGAFRLLIAQMSFISAYIISLMVMPKRSLRAARMSCADWDIILLKNWRI